MEFEQVRRMGALLSKEYSGEFFRLLVTYRDISASEAASRLNLHIRTAQEFLDGLTGLDILDKEEVFEKKRPYFRYSLKTERISLSLDLTAFFGSERKKRETGKPIREKKNAGARFTTARSGDHISAVTLWIGKGRDREERKINLTPAQGRFLFHLPFPSASPLTVEEISAKAGMQGEHRAEIMDIVTLLEEFGVIETVEG